MPPCTIGVMAYNEEQNIRQVLYALLNQQQATLDIVEIVVVASGCTDRTVEFAREIARLHPIIKIEVQPERKGKAAAVNRLISIARGEVIVLVGADTLPDPEALEHLLQPFNDPTVGMTGARILPVNTPTTHLGFTVHLLWRVHHRMAQRWPKLGELIAFRNVVPEIPTTNATDEVALEALLSAKSYRLVYTPKAVVYNCGPQTVSDFFLQRRRIFAGHLDIVARFGYVAASMRIRTIGVMAYDLICRYPLMLPYILVALSLEGWARLLGLLDFLRGQNHHRWRPVLSTKQVDQTLGPLTLVRVRHQHADLRSSRMVRIMRRIPAEDGALLHWNANRQEILFRLPKDERAAVSLQQRINKLVAHINLSDQLTDDTQLSYQVVQFGAGNLWQWDAVVESRATLPVLIARPTVGAKEPVHT